MQSEFETLQRRGLTETGSETLQSILKRAARQLARCLCYRYGCWRSELCQTIIHSWCSYRKWLQWGRNNCCKGNSGKQSGADMPTIEVLRRLSAWKAETANKDVLYLNFDDVFEAPSWQSAAAAAKRHALGFGLFEHGFPMRVSTARRRNRTNLWKHCSRAAWSRILIRPKRKRLGDPRNAIPKPGPF